MNYLLEQQKKANINLESVRVQSRLERRSLWDKLLTVVIGILGFSLTLFSTDFLSSTILHSCSKYYLLVSWLLYTSSLFVGFFLLKKETGFQEKESVRQTLYAMDTAELLDDKTLNVKNGKDGQYIALMVLRDKSISVNSSWSELAMRIYEENKKDLNSYKLAGNPDKLYSIKDRVIITWSERVFYSLIILGTVSLIISVALIVLREVKITNSTDVSQPATSNVQDSRLDK